MLTTKSAFWTRAIRPETVTGGWFVRTTHPMQIPPRPPTARMHIRLHRAPRCSGTRQHGPGPRRNRTRTRRRNNHHRRPSPTTPHSSMLRRPIIPPTIRRKPRHNLLIIARSRADGIADARGGVVEGGQVSGLAEAGPDGLGGGCGAAAGLRGLGEERAGGGAGGELGVAVGEELGGGGGREKGEGEEAGRSVEAHGVR